MLNTPHIFVRSFIIQRNYANRYYKSSSSLHKTEDKEYRFALFKKKMYL